jgi:hypothetical protein
MNEYAILHFQRIFHKIFSRNLFDRKFLTFFPLIVMIMKIISAISLFLSLLLLDPVVSESDATVYLAVVTLVTPKSLSPAQIQSVNTSMTELSTVLDEEISQVAVAAEKEMAATSETSWNDLNLRGRMLQSCNPCVGWGTGTYCYWNGRWAKACRREDRQLYIHTKLSDTELSAMNDDDRRRHLQINAMCDEAVADVVVAIENDIQQGVITAPMSSFSQHCMYDIE